MSDGSRDPDRERDAKGDEITDRLSSRFEGDVDDADESKTPKTAQPSETASTSKTSESETTSVKERPSVLMYLPDELHGELDIRFDELNARYKREHGEPLEKNRDYYPAVVKAALEGEDLEDVLDL
jgi:hypothetical protein